MGLKNDVSFSVLLLLIGRLNMDEDFGVFANYIPDLDHAEIPWFSRNYESKSRAKSGDCSCGIFVNVTANPTPYPWQVLMYAMTSETQPSDDSTLPDMICSGAIINDRMILSTISCLLQLPPVKPGGFNTSDLTWIFTNRLKYIYKNIVVVKPSTTKILMKDIKQDEQLEVKEVIFSGLHPFQMLISRKLANDIALVILKTPLDLGHITPLCLTSRFINEKELFGTEAVSAGWKAYLEPDGTSSNTSTVAFEFAPLPKTTFRPRLHCSVTAAVEPLLVSEAFLCSDPPPITKSFDAVIDGAPFMVNSKQNPSQFIMVGIHSTQFIFTYGLNPPVNIVTHVSGFLEIIDRIASGAQAKWCHGEPNVDFLGEPQKSNVDLLQKMAEVEQRWKSVDSTFRRKLGNSICKCGILNSQKSGRIQGGSNTKMYEFGWQTMVLHLAGEQSSLCGGTVINDKIVLTAGHCVRAVTSHRSGDSIIGDLDLPENYNVQIIRYSGVYSGVYGDERSRIVTVERIIPHPKFEKSLLDNGIYDIALIILKDRIDFHELKRWVSPVCLPETGEPPFAVPGRTDALTLGWGGTSISDGNELGFYLQQLNVTVLTKSHCLENWEAGINAAERLGKEKLPEKFRKFELTNRVCAGTEGNYDTYRDPLPGDSGGPLMVPLRQSSTVSGGYETNPHVQIGITSVVNVPLLQALKPRGVLTPSVVVYISVSDMLPFIDYYSFLVKAQWCPRE